MPLTTIAGDIIADALIGGVTYPRLTPANAHIGVGDGTTAFAAGQTDLQGTNKVRRAMNTGYPTRTANSITLQATFGTEDANFDWNEWGVFNSSSGGNMFCRKVESLGTKTNSATWQLSVTLTFNVS